jgi:hypothetical protein
MLNKAMEAQLRIISSINVKYGEGMKISMNKSRQRCTNTLNKANEI